MARTTSKTQVAYYTIYKASTKWKTNREKKLKRQLALNPTNAKQIEDALANIRYRRKTPKSPTWSHTNIALAKLFKEFTGSFDNLILSKIPTVSAEALRKAGSKNPAPYSDRVSFKLKDRARDSSTKNLVWSY